MPIRDDKRVAVLIATSQNNTKKLRCFYSYLDHEYQAGLYLVGNGLQLFGTVVWHYIKLKGKFPSGQTFRELSLFHSYGV